MTIRQCPQCELRFPTKSELEFHRTIDHSEKAPVGDESLKDDHGDRVNGATGEGSP